MSVSGLFTKIYRDIINGEVDLIRLPDVATRLRKALSDQDIDIETLARVVQTDIAASAYVLSIANSPVYRTRVKAADIASAIRLMGIPAFANLITVYAVRSLIGSSDPTILKYLKAYWQKSAHRAAIASAVAKTAGGIDADRALLSGLLRDVGGLPILMKLQGDQLASLSVDSIDEALEAYTAKVGVVLAKHWDLDQYLVDVIKNAGNLSYDGGDGIDLVDVVNIAHLLSQIGGRELKWPRLEETPCLQKFGESGLTMETSLSLLKQAQDDINEIRQLLSV